MGALLGMGMGGIGHNGGPSLEPGYGFRKHAWTEARKALLPTLPLEILRIRVARAERLGLPYRTYATIRATSGRDIVAFLFSSNALGLTPARPVCLAPEAARLGALDGAAMRLGAIHLPIDPARVATDNATLLEAAARAPGFVDRWSKVRRDLRAMVQSHGLPVDGVVLVPATAVEREWCGAAGLAGIIPADRFFAPPG